MKLDLHLIVLLASGFGSLATIIILFVRLTWWLAKEFSQVREITYRLHRENQKRFLRLELWANRKGFQPAIDPNDFNGGDRTHNN